MVVLQVYLGAFVWGTLHCYRMEGDNENGSFGKMQAMFRCILDGCAFPTTNQI